MTTEEKAKAYDEALERAKQKHGKFSEFVTKTIEEIFPELRESKDKRIRFDLRKLRNMAILIIPPKHTRQEREDGRKRLRDYFKKKKDFEPK